jgi:hypothetical protein
LFQGVGKVILFMLLLTSTVHASDDLKWSPEEIQANYKLFKQTIRSTPEYEMIPIPQRQSLETMEGLCEFYVDHSEDFTALFKQSKTLSQGLQLIKNRATSLHRPITLFKYNQERLTGKSGQALTDSVMQMCYEPMAIVSKGYQIAMGNPILFPGLFNALTMKDGCVAKRATKLSGWLSKNM